MFDLKIEWDEGFLNHSDPQYAATGAKLQIWVDGKNLARHIDFFEGETFDYLCIPVYPLAEWFVINWWYLKAETGTQEDESFRYRHFLNRAIAGFAIPEIVFLPEGEWMFIKWNKYSHEFARVNYIENGSLRVPARGFWNQVESFIEQVCEQLKAQNIITSSLQQDWEMLGSMEDAEKEFCLAVASMGEDPDNISDRRANEIIKVAEVLPQSVVLPFFEVMQGLSIKGVDQKIRQVMDCAMEVGYDYENLQQWKDEVKKVRYKNHLPWEKGYGYARKLRAYLGEDLVSGGTLEDLFQIAGIPQTLPDFNLNGASSRIEGMIAYGKENTPVFTLSNKNMDSPFYDASRRFAFCRELYEYLIAGDTQPSLITSASNSRQQANRAFAAELLVPKEELKRKLKGRQNLFGADIEGLAGDFKVSSFVIQHQINNHQLAHIRG